MKVIESDKVPPLFRLLLMNNPYADAIIRDVQELVELQSVDPIKAAGGCYCRECSYYETRFPGYGYCYYWDHEQGMSPNSVEDNDFCSYGEPGEAQDDG